MEGDWAVVPAGSEFLCRIEDLGVPGTLDGLSHVVSKEVSSKRGRKTMILTEQYQLSYSSFLLELFLGDNMKKWSQCFTFQVMTCLRIRVNWHLCFISFKLTYNADALKSGLFCCWKLDQSWMWWYFVSTQKWEWFLGAFKKGKWSVYLFSFYLLLSRLYVIGEFWIA